MPRLSRHLGPQALAGPLGGNKDPSRESKPGNSAENKPGSMFGNMAGNEPPSRHASIPSSRPAPLDAAFGSAKLAQRGLFAQVEALRQPMADALLLMADALHCGGRSIFMGNGLAGVVARLLADTSFPLCQRIRHAAVYRPQR